ncbi:MAG: hypothetical protein KJ559_03960 [Nanoarchaeota archaeon]|nr:hypothetical protein [Nanoarchaeota archaeon]
MVLISGRRNRTSYEEDIRGYTSYEDTLGFAKTREFYKKQISQGYKFHSNVSERIYPSDEIIKRLKTGGFETFVGNVSFYPDGKEVEGGKVILKRRKPSTTKE